MKHTYYCTLKGAFLALALPLALASCSFDGDYDDCAEAVGDVKTVRLQITANDPDEVAGTRFSPAEGDIIDNERGTDGEYINSLDIFIVSSAPSANVVYALHLDAAKLGGDAANGNLTSYTSERIELTDGTPYYTVYAFANMSDTYASEWSSSVASIDEGGTLTASTLNDIMLDDPAGKLDFKNGKFIPMSASYDIDITSLASPVIEVGLDRLVSKIRLGIKKASNVNVTNLTISGWADKVPLMNSATVTGATYECEKTFTPPVLKEDNDVYMMADFYVNESPAANPLDVTVTTDEPGAPTYTATTSRDNIPRNCIYPLTLNINQLDLQLTAGFYFNAIGARVPVAVSNSGEDEFNVSIPDGMEFYLDAEMTGDQGGNTFTYAWAETDGTPEGFTLYDDNNDQTDQVTGAHIAGAIPALGLGSGESGGTYTLDLDVTWSTHSRHYTVNISHIPFIEADWLDQILGTRSAVSSYLQPETLNMVINK